MTTPQEDLARRNRAVAARVHPNLDLEADATHAIGVMLNDDSLVNRLVNRADEQENERKSDAPHRLEVRARHR